jgi:hypothetical protein
MEAKELSFILILFQFKALPHIGAGFNVFSEPYDTGLLTVQILRDVYKEKGQFFSALFFRIMCKYLRV